MYVKMWKYGKNMEGFDSNWIWVLSSIIFCQITSLRLSGKLNHMSWSLNFSYFYFIKSMLRFHCYLLLEDGFFWGKLSVILHSFKNIVFEFDIELPKYLWILQLRSGLKQAPGNNWLWHADKKNKRSSHEYYCTFHHT